MQEIAKFSSVYSILVLVLFSRVTISRSDLTTPSSGDLSRRYTNKSEADGSSGNTTTVKLATIYNENTTTERATTVSTVDSQTKFHPTTFVPWQVPSVTSVDKPTDATTPVKVGDIAAEDVTTTEQMRVSGNGYNSVTDVVVEQVPTSKVGIHFEGNVVSSGNNQSVFETTTKSSRTKIQGYYENSTVKETQQFAENNATVDVLVNDTQLLTPKDTSPTEPVSVSENITKPVSVEVSENITKKVSVELQQQMPGFEINENITTPRSSDGLHGGSDGTTTGSGNGTPGNTTVNDNSPNKTLSGEEIIGTGNETGFQYAAHPPSPPLNQDMDDEENGKQKQRNTHVVDDPPLLPTTEIPSSLENATSVVEHETITIKITNPTTVVNNWTQEDLQHQSTQPSTVDSTAVYKKESTVQPPTTTTSPSTTTTTSATTTSTPTQNTTLVPPTDNNDNVHAVDHFFRDLRLHTVLCMVSILLLLLAGTILFSFILAGFLLVKYSLIGLVKLCKALKKCCTRRKCSSGNNGSGFHESGSLFPRCDISIRPYDARVTNERDRELMY